MATPAEAFGEAERAGLVRRIVTPQEAIAALVGHKLSVTLFEQSEIEGKYKKRTIEGTVNSGDTEMLYLGIDVTSSKVVLESQSRLDAPSDLR